MPIPSAKPPAAHIAWAKFLRENIPGNSIKVSRHYDEGERNAIAIFTSESAEGIAAATVGLMDYDQGGGAGPPLATEILLDARGRPCDVANVVGTIAFCIMKDGWKVAPGVTFPDVVAMYAPELQVKHILFLPPYQWGSGMSRVTLGDRTILPLLAVPITESELRLIEQQGADELTDRWARLSTDVLDWAREGVA